ncbi:MAG TPA: HEAT repeat domain-containing protein [Gemmatimonadales bacterium]|nr:HEAT repeat domain-containing protein [Gemmatimonadales bacterium]
MHPSLHALMLAALLPGSLAAQSLAHRVNAAGDGTVRLSFAARPGICADGANGITMRQASNEWEPACSPSLVRVALGLSAHRVRSIRTYVGGRWLPATSVLDLGTVRPQEAASYFIGLSNQSGDSSVAGDALLPAVLADSVIIWPSLVAIARSSRLSSKTRSRAVFWLSQAAGAAAGQALDSIAADDRGEREVRKQAIFALSQRSGNEGVPALIRIARTNKDPELRKTALFWLGQSEDARALDLFEEILR